MELLIGFTLILGIATRYAALVCALFLIVATALAHRYWEYPLSTPTSSRTLRSWAVPCSYS